MDEEADAGDDEQHDERKLVKDEAEVNVEGANVKPLAVGLRVRESNGGSADSKRIYGAMNHDPEGR